MSYWQDRLEAAIKRGTTRQEPPTPVVERARITGWKYENHDNYVTMVTFGGTRLAFVVSYDELRRLESWQNQELDIIIQPSKK